MSENYYNLLSKSAVNEPMSYKKSPSKYNIYDSSNLNNQTEKSTPSWKEWKPTSDYQNVNKKLPQNYASLRQTFDSRTDSKLEEKISKYGINQNEKINERPKINVALRQTFHTKTSSPTFKNSLAESAALQRTPTTEDSSKFQSEIIPKYRKSQNIGKGKNYVEMVDKFKEELENSKKLSLQIQKLKQDRKKRELEKQKQAKKDKTPNKVQDENTETFKKKDYVECYTPKLSKASYHDRFKVSRMNTISESQKYSYSQKTQKDLTSPVSARISKLSENKTAGKAQSKYSRKLSEFETGVSLNDFNLGKTLGQGKFGVVYQALHKKTKTIYAIKKVPKDMIKSHLMIDQFSLQLKLQTFLNHQNILSLYAYFHDEKSIYLVLEYMQEGTLFTHLKKNKTLPEAQVAIKIKQIASAIKYLHQNTIAHRDIKPQNIVMSHGICKLCDFGWATVCDDRRKTYCGTFDYAPPQILEGVQYDYTVDLWCLGILTYELLVGKAPFYHISRKETMKRILNVENTQIEFPQNISRSAISFVDSLVKKDPQHRMSTDVILEHPFLKYADKN